MFKKKYLTVYITDESIVASEFHNGIFIDQPIAEAIKQINIEWDYTKNIYEQREIIIALLNHCISKLDIKFMDSLVLLTVIPLEYFGSCRDNIFDDIILKVKHLGALYAWENIISAAACFLKKISADYKRKFMIYGENEKTYISLLWAGMVVDFICIEKELADITKEDLLNSINNISKKVTSEIPKEFVMHPSFDKFEYSWKEAIENNVYVTAPNQVQNIWGESLDEYKLVYIEYEKDIVLKGANDVFFADLIKSKYKFRKLNSTY